MRLALLIYGTLDTLSGGYLYDRKLVEHLRAQGDQVEILSLPWRSYAAHLADNLAPGLQRRLRSGGWDALIQDELNHPSLFWLNRWLKPRVRYPILSIVHHLRISEAHPRFLQRVYRAVESRYLQTIDGFVFNSQTTCEVVAGLVNPLPPFHIAYPAGDRFAPEISEADIRARALATGPLRIFFLGNIIPRKGLHTLLAAVEMLPRDLDWRLEIAGGLHIEPAYARRMQAAVAAGNWGARVKFLGTLPDTELAARLRASHTLVVPSTYEGFGIVYLEGMSFGLPAIAGATGAAPEIVTEDVNGFLVPADEPRLLALRLVQLGRDRSLLARMSLAARRRYREHPTWETSMAGTRAFFQDTITLQTS